MSGIESLYILLGAVMLVLVLAVFLKKPSKVQSYFLIMMAAAGISSVFYGIELSYTNPEDILLMIRLQYIVLPFIAPIWVIYAFKYIGQQHYIKNPAVCALLLFAVPAIVLITALSPFAVPYLYSSVHFAATSSGLIIADGYGGIVYYLYMLYQIALYLVSFIVLFRFMRSSEGIFKNLAITLVTVNAIILGSIAVQVLFFKPVLHLEFMPIVYLAVFLIVIFSLQKYRLFSVLPVAYATIFEDMPSAVVITDSLGRVLNANYMSDEIFGTKLSLMTGDSLLSVAKNWPEFTYLFESVINEEYSGFTGGLFSGGLAKWNGSGKISETISKTGADGMPYQYTVKFSGLRDKTHKGRNCTGYIISISDVTDEKLMEYKLKESENFYRGLFEHSPVGYLALDTDFNIREVNAELLNISGYTIEEVKGHNIFEFLPQSNRSHFMDGVPRLIERGYIYFDCDCLFKNDEVHTVLVNINVQYDESHVPKMIHLVVQDISDRKRMENALSQANRKLNLLSSITRHDVMNQVTVLQGYQEIIYDLIAEGSPDPDTLKSFVEKEKRAAENIANQISFTQNYQDIGVKACIWQDIRELFTIAASAFYNDKIKIECNVTDIEVYADPLLEKVFFNLIDNSLRYGEKLTQISLSSTVDESNNLLLIYRDNGLGINEKYKEDIFSRKYFHHSGYGLFLSREILGITDIVIKEQGHYGSGVEFLITVPASVWKTTSTK